VAVKRWGHDTEPISFNAASMAVGAGALAGVSLIAREPWGVPTWPQGLGAILYLAIAGSVVTFVAWQWLLKEMQATFISYIALVIPIVAVLLGASLGNERFDVIDLAGAGIVLLGIYVSTSRRAAAFARAATGQGIADPDPVDPPPRKT
jgi:drug/metabolite transporter (DMT)-like permease